MKFKIGQFVIFTKDSPYGMAGKVRKIVAIGMDNTTIQTEVICLDDFNRFFIPDRISGGLEDWVIVARKQLLFNWK